MARDMRANKCTNHDVHNLVLGIYGWNFERQANARSSQ
jgi:hypothetical protein